MPIEVGVWRLGDKPEKITISSIEKELKLENAVFADLTILSPNLLLIGRQVPTAYGKFIDILAMDRDGNLSLYELKRGRTPREVVAQLLDYGSWVTRLSREEIAEIYSQKNDGEALETGFADVFGGPLPDEVNQQHQLFVVASELDPSTERIISYLSDSYGVPINALFFQYFRDNGNEYLARTWLIDPEEAEVKSSKSASRKKSEPWNGRDFYISFGEHENEKYRSWDDARQYGFVSAGGGRWYSQTLDLLFPGARVFVNIPKKGYVGVGIVKDAAVQAKDFMVMHDGKSVPLLQLPLRAQKMGRDSDPDTAEYVVRVDWLKAVPVEEAYWEKGLFAIQHSACRMRSTFTIQQLSKHFQLED